MKQEILTLFSADNWHRVSIQKGDDNILRVMTYTWTHEFVPGHGEVCDPFWELISGPSFTDNVESAKKIAEEEFKRLSGETTYTECWEEPKGK